MSDLYHQSKVERARARRELARCGEFTHGDDAGIFALDGKSSHGICESDLASLDAMIDAHGVKNILLAVKELLSSRAESDFANLDGKYERAANALSLMALDSKLRGV